LLALVCFTLLRFAATWNCQDYANIEDDLDYEYSKEEAMTVSTNPEHLAKLKKYQAKLKISVISEPRQEKKLLVLDLDYTLFDMKSKADSFMHLKRPFTDEFLSALYPYYDLVVWSQTSWKWLEIKLTELGMLTHPRYKLCFVLDKSCMFSVNSKKGKHQVKAMQLIWSKFPELWSPKNSIHIDDLGRNFAMNPGQGLKIAPYKRAHENRHTDKELLYLKNYLLLLKDIDDFETLDHGDWKNYTATYAHTLNN